MNAILHELNVPKDPIPTKRNCDLYDGVRKDALTLLILQKIVLRKEGELNAKREKLLEIQSTAAAAVVAREEAEKKKMDDDGKKKSNKEEGGAKTSSKAPAKSKTSKRPRDKSAMSTQDKTTVGGDGVAKEGGDDMKPKKKYQKKKKADTASTAVGASTAAGATKFDVSSSALTPIDPSVGMIQIPTVANPTVSPMVISKKKLAVNKPTPVEKAGDEKNNTLAPAIPSAVAKEKRGRKPKKKDD
jgi:DNA methyltransferase 1-associated protein 1